MSRVLMIEHLPNGIVTDNNILKVGEHILKTSGANNPQLA